MIIDRLRWWHIDELLPMEADLFGHERWTAAMFWSELANGHYYIGAFDSGDKTDDPALIGYAGLALAPPAEAWINNIAVRRDRQRHGVGRALLEALLAQASRAGVRHELLEVAADNGPAQRLYDEYGFAVVGVRRGYYQPSGTDALVMRRGEPGSGPA
jgi:[ribosomal protein S18]-alanine N-acetyltransferase